MTRETNATTGQQAEWDRSREGTYGPTFWRSPLGSAEASMADVEVQVEEQQEEEEEEEEQSSSGSSRSGNESSRRDQHDPAKDMQERAGVDRTKGHERGVGQGDSSAVATPRAQNARGAAPGTSCSPVASRTGGSAGQYGE